MTVKTTDYKDILKPEFIYSYHKTACGICGRRVLVEIHLIGADHNAGVHATCAECLSGKGIMEGFRGKHPEAARDIGKWLNYNGEASS